MKGLTRNNHIDTGSREARGLGAARLTIKLRVDGKLVGITVKKGVVDDGIPKEKAHYVDGLAGATITSNGVTIGVKNDLEAFEPYLDKARSN